MTFQRMYGSTRVYWQVRGHLKSGDKVPRISQMRQGSPVSDIAYVCRAPEGHQALKRVRIAFEHDIVK